jgi:hypothetical protein
MPPVSIPNTYKLGMLIVVSGVFVLLAVLAVVDIAFAARRSASIGYRLESWSWNNPWLAAALLVIFGALVAHFVLNRWPS